MGLVACSCRHRVFHSSLCPQRGGLRQQPVPESLDSLRRSGKRHARLKGRQGDELSTQEVRALIGLRPEGGHRRDLLIEYLHRLNDLYLGLHERHLVALAQEMKLPMAEVYEVASFYHHFEILREGQSAPALTVRVCEGLACEMHGARDLLERLP